MVEALVEVGAALRAAQDDLDPDALRSLGEQRRRLIARIAARAVALAEERGQRIGPSIRDDIERTLQAVLADGPAAEAVRTGRLVRALGTDGLDPVDLGGAVAGDSAAPSAVVRRHETTKGGRGAHGDADDVAAARERKQRVEERKRALEEASSELEAAGERARRAHDDREAAGRRHDDLLSERDRLQALLDEIDERLLHSVSDMDAATTAVADADDALAVAEEKRSRAEADYASLRSEPGRARSFRSGES
jgi:hypothetical protein